MENGNKTRARGCGAWRKEEGVGPRATVLPAKIVVWPTENVQQTNMS